MVGDSVCRCLMARRCSLCGFAWRRSTQQLLVYSVLWFYFVRSIAPMHYGKVEEFVLLFPWEANTMSISGQLNRVTSFNPTHA